MEQKQRIPYVDPEDVRDDEDMYAEFLRCAREGTPRPESQAIRAHVPATFWSFAKTWQSVFHEGVCEHAVKELCRVYVSRSVKCEFCGNQRSEKTPSCSGMGNPPERRRGGWCAAPAGPGGDTRLRLEPQREKSPLVFAADPGMFAGYYG